MFVSEAEETTQVSGSSNRNANIARNVNVNRNANANATRTGLETSDEQDSSDSSCIVSEDGSVTELLNNAREQLGSVIKKTPPATEAAEKVPPGKKGKANKEKEKVKSPIRVDANGGGRELVPYSNEEARKSREKSREKEKRKKNTRRRQQHSSDSSDGSEPPKKKPKKAAEKKKKQQRQRESSSNSSSGPGSSSSHESDSSKDSSSESKDSSPDSEDAESGSSEKGKKVKKRTRSSKKRDKEREKIDWELLNIAWPIEDRPRGLQKKKNVRGRDIDALVRLKREVVGEKEKEELGESAFRRDAVVRKTRYKAKTDDGYKRLHPVRSLRQPLSRPSKWFGKLVPVKRTTVVRNFPLDHYGAAGQVSEKTLGKLHNRSVELPFESFCKTNPLEGKGKEVLCSVKQLQDGVHNYCVMLHALWPNDYSGLVLQKVLMEANWAEDTGLDEYRRARLIRCFATDVLKINAGRSIHKQHPLEYEQVWNYSNYLRKTFF